MFNSTVAQPTKQSSLVSKILFQKEPIIIAIGMDPRALMQILVINYLSPLILMKNVEILSLLVLQITSRKVVQEVEPIVSIRNINFSVSGTVLRIKNVFGETPNVFH